MSATVPVAAVALHLLFVSSSALRFTSSSALCYVRPMCAGTCVYACAGMVCTWRVLSASSSPSVRSVSTGFPRVRSGVSATVPVVAVALHLLLCVEKEFLFLKLDSSLPHLGHLGPAAVLAGLSPCSVLTILTVLAWRVKAYFF